MCEYNIENIVDSAKCIILDIEGTTTSLDFVKKELFPYAGKHLAEYVKMHWNEDKMKEVINLLIEDQGMLALDEGFVPLPASFDSCDKEQFQAIVISHLEWQMARDCKSTGLKKLQGYIWMSGYSKGLLLGHVYEDVPVALKYWKSLGKKIYIYSSGSIQAQKLLFCNSIIGDLDKFIDGNFDTTSGSKVDLKSYLRIAEQIDENPENIVFFTDRPKEVVAAKKSGMKVVMINREETNPFLKQEEEFLGYEDGTLNSFLPILKQA